VTWLPDPESFLSGEHGEVGGRRGALRRAADVALDRWLAASGALRAMDAAAARVPPRDVLVASVYRPPGDMLAAALPSLGSARHRVRLALGSTGEPTLPGTAAGHLGGGKFENLNVLVRGEAAAAGAGGAAGGGAAPAGPGEAAAAGAGGAAGGGAAPARAASGGSGPAPDWVLVVDDDVALPARFLDRMVGLAEHFGLQLAQPAQSLASHAAWRVARRRPRSILRETRFVEIGPVTLFSRQAAQTLLPFPALRYGWGLDLAWAAEAHENGWRLGIADALAVRHETGTVGSAYSADGAIEEAREFLSTRPYLSGAAAQETLAVHRSLKR
jgi:hypothetical protein